MTEKLSINLTEGDVDVREKSSDPGERNVTEFIARCPLCNLDIVLTRIGKMLCDCNIEWKVEVKIVGKRALDDDDKFQMGMFDRAKESKDEGAFWAKEAEEMSDARGNTEKPEHWADEIDEQTTPKPETPEFETTG